MPWRPTPRSWWAVAKWPPSFGGRSASGGSGSLPSRAQKGEYHIAFDTKSTPGFLRSVKVTLELDMLPDDTGMPADQQEKYNIALCDHPLYAELRRYCEANPPGGKPKR